MMIRTMAVHKDGRYKYNVSLEELQLHSKDFVWYWVDFSNPTQDEYAYLSSYFKFDSSTIDDCLHYLQRPKMEYFNEYSFIILQSLNKDMSIVEVDLFLSPNFIVTVCKEANHEIQMVWEKIKTNKSLIKKSEDILYQLSDEIVDNFFPIAFAIEDRIEEIGDLNPDLGQEIIDGVRESLTKLSKLRKSVHPMRDLMYRIKNSTHVAISNKSKSHYINDVYDHLVKLSEIINHNREIANDIRESCISTNSHKMNHIMKTLTVVSIFFMPLTFIVGLYGMNFENMPELHSQYGYPLCCMTMLIIIFGMWSWFKKKGWF